MNNTEEKVISWFSGSENFKYLPKDIQEKIVSFFVEQSITAVDACQIIEFLEFGSNFTVYYDYNEFIDSLDFSNTKAILACKANFDDFDNVTPWADSFHPKLIKSITPSYSKIKELQRNNISADLFIKLVTENIYEVDVQVVPMFNTVDYLDIEFYLISY